MRRLSAALLSVALLANGSASAQNNPSSVPNRPDALVSKLYEQVVGRHPIGIPYGADMKIFAPYLSRALLHRFALNNACLADWYHQNPDPNLKPIVGMFEDGVFSGPSEKAEPKDFRVDRFEAGSDGTSRVYVRLTWENPPSKPLIWYVATLVVPENGRLVVDDVLFLKDKRGDIESRLSKELSSGCNDGRWVGR